MYEDVYHDVSLAEKALTDHGIIAIDDFCNRIWPEVTFATHDVLNGLEGLLEPFAMTGKLYIAQGLSMRKFIAIGFRSHLQTMCGTR